MCFASLGLKFWIRAARSPCCGADPEAPYHWLSSTGCRLWLGPSSACAGPSLPRRLWLRPTGSGSARAGPAALPTTWVSNSRSLQPLMTSLQVRAAPLSIVCKRYLTLVSQMGAAGGSAPPSYPPSSPSALAPSLIFYLFYYYISLLCFPVILSWRTMIQI